MALTLSPPRCVPLPLVPQHASQQAQHIRLQCLQIAGLRDWPLYLALIKVASGDGGGEEPPEGTRAMGWSVVHGKRVFLLYKSKREQSSVVRTRLLMES